jgi:hypothetical protein
LGHGTAEDEPVHQAGDAPWFTEHVKKAQRYLKPGLKDRGAIDVSIGARMGVVSALAKEFTDMPLGRWRSCRTVRCMRCVSARSASCTTKLATSGRRRSVARSCLT